MRCCRTGEENGRDDGVAVNTVVDIESHDTPVMMRRDLYCRVVLP